MDKTKELRLKPVKEDADLVCSQTCCSRKARMLVDGYPLCEVCLQTKLGPVKIKLGTGPVVDLDKPCG